jgi:HEAT repeat protein
LLGAIVIAALAGAGVWFVLRGPEPARPGADDAAAADDWLDALYSQNPREVEAATEEVGRMGARAVPAIQAVLQDPRAEAERIKAALKACGIIGRACAPAVPDVAAALVEPGLTAEAAIALSYAGREAFPPLRDALSSDDPIVRREALRSIGKLKERAPLDRALVVPLLVSGLEDRDEGVRAVAATYLGIVRDGADQAVPALIRALTDPDAEVRRASAAALGSFGESAAPALPALRKAAADRNEDVAQEAGRTIVRLQGAEKRPPRR